MRIRIENDIVLNLSVFRPGDMPEELSDATDMKVLLTCKGKEYTPSFTYSDNKVIVYFTAAMQKEIGYYTVTLQYSKPDATMPVGKGVYTVDCCEAFKLVPRSCESDDMQKSSVQTLDLSVTIDRGQGSGTSDYAKLSNRPYINDVELVGSLSLEDLGIASPDLSDYATTEEVSAEISKLKDVYTTPEQVSGEIGKLKDVYTTPEQVKTEIGKLSEVYTTPKQVTDEISKLSDVYATPKQLSDEIVKLEEVYATPQQVTDEIDKLGGMYVSKEGYISFSQTEKERLAAVTQPTSFKWVDGMYQPASVPPDFNEDVYQISACAFEDTNPIDNPMMKIGEKVYALKINDQFPLKFRISKEEICSIWFFRDEARMFGLDSNRATIEEAQVGEDKNKYITPETMKVVVDSVSDTIPQLVPLTQEEYDALTDDKLSDNKYYFTV